MCVCKAETAAQPLTTAIHSLLQYTFEELSAGVQASEGEIQQALVRSNALLIHGVFRGARHVARRFALLILGLFVHFITLRPLARSRLCVFVPRSRLGVKNNHRARLVIPQGPARLVRCRSRATQHTKCCCGTLLADARARAAA